VPRSSISRPVLLVFIALSASAACGRRDRVDVGRYVSMYPGPGVVDMPGDEARMSVLVRNVSEIKLTGLRLEIKCDACRSTEVKPAQLGELIPGDRSSFAVLLKRQPGKAAQRHPLQLTLHAQGLPVPAGLDLLVDLSPVLEKGWIEVGQVTIVAGSQRRTAVYLLAGVPLLLVVGWMLWRFSRRRRAPAKPQS
jgi:hypothetical protein